MDLLRSCYEAEVRFYRDIPDTVRVRWFFVPEGTPFVPHKNNWVSSNWDSDPKPSWHLGEQPEYGRTWTNGTGPNVVWPLTHVCGTPEQWSQGQPLPPETPVPLDENGVPMCCFQGVPPLPPVPPPPPQQALELWLRREELPAYGEGNVIPLWPPAPPTIRAGYPAAFTVAPTYLTDAATASPGGRFTRSPQFASLRYPNIALPDDFTIYLVARPAAEASPTNRPGPSVSGDDGTFLGVQGTRLLAIIDGDARITAHTLPPGESHVWTFMRDNGTLYISKDGEPVAVESSLDGNASLDLWLATMASPLTTHHCWLPEVLVYSRALSLEEDAQVLDYLRDRFPPG